MVLGWEGGAGDPGALPRHGLQREARHSLTTSRHKTKQLCTWGDQGVLSGRYSLSQPRSPTVAQH